MELLETSVKVFNHDIETAAKRTPLLDPTDSRIRQALRVGLEL